MWLVVLLLVIVGPLCGWVCGLSCVVGGCVWWVVCSCVWVVGGLVVVVVVLRHAAWLLDEMPLYLYERANPPVPRNFGPTKADSLLARCLVSGRRAFLTLGC